MASPDDINVRHLMSNIAQSAGAQGTSNALRSILRVCGVFLLHVAIGFTLYRESAVDHWALGVFAVIYLPLFLALFGYYFALRSSGWFTRHVAARIAVSFLGAFLSLWVYMVAALNTYGS